MKIKIDKTKKTILGVTLIGVMFVSVMFTTTFINTDSKMNLWNRIEDVRNNLIVSATNGTGGSVTNGADEIVNILIYPHDGSPATTYSDNLSEGDAYEHFDNSFSNGEELEGETPHSTTFDIVVIMQYDKDHVYDTAWNISLVDCWCNESQLSISSQKMEKSTAFFDIQADDGKICFYLQDADGGAGSGFTISQLEQIDDIQFKPYYYG